MTGWGWAVWLVLATGPAASGAGDVLDRADQRASLADRVDLGGSVSLMLDGLPRRNAAELRPKAVVDVTVDVSARVRAHATIRAAALIARRDGRLVRDGLLRPDDAWVEIATDRTELRAGYGVVAWGRLDELQPTDVVNPIDTAAFLLDGRAAARLPVGFARGRYYVGQRVLLEGVVVPWFRRSTFDEMDETSSPFNLGGPGAPVEPEPGWSSVSGGGRATVTIGRTDVSGVVYRGFDGFGPHERFTMAGGDVESAVGTWILRGEIAAFVRKRLASASRPGLVDGHVVDAGAGVERRIGPARASALVTVRRQWSAEDPAVDGTDVSVLGSIERPFARERYRARMFGLVNPADRSAFLRALLSWDARDNVSVDLSAALFLGEGDDLVSRFSDRDFLFLRLGYYF